MGTGLVLNVIFTGSDRTSYYRTGPAIIGPGQSRPVRANPVPIRYRDEATSGGRGGGIFSLWGGQTALKIKSSYIHLHFSQNGPKWAKNAPKWAEFGRKCPETFLYTTHHNIPLSSITVDHLQSHPRKMSYCVLYRKMGWLRTLFEVFEPQISRKLLGNKNVIYFFYITPFSYAELSDSLWETCLSVHTGPMMEWDWHFSTWGDFGQNRLKFNCSTECLSTNALILRGLVNIFFTLCPSWADIHYCLSLGAQCYAYCTPVK